MSYINSVVDKVYVINLDKDTERLKAIDKKLRDVGIAYERFPAILGSTIKSDHRLAGFCNEFCTDGIKGCALSHHTIWEKAIYEGYDSILVLEDDAHIDSEIHEKVRDLMTRVPDWDIIYVGCRTYCNNEYATNKALHTVLGTGPKPVDEKGDLSHVSGSAGAHAIMYRTRFLKKIINEPIYTHIDMELFRWISRTKAKAFGLYPEIVPLNEEMANTSNLSDTFPPLFNTLFNKVELSDHVPLGWVMSENLFKLGGLYINPLLITLILLCCIAPLWLLGLLVGWLTLELAMSSDFKNYFRFLTVMCFTVLLRYGLVKGVDRVKEGFYGIRRWTG